MIWQGWFLGVCFIICSEGGGRCAVNIPQKQWGTDGNELRIFRKNSRRLEEMSCGTSHKNGGELMEMSCGTSHKDSGELMEMSCEYSAKAVGDWRKNELRNIPQNSGELMEMSCEHSAKAVGDWRK